MIKSANIGVLWLDNPSSMQHICGSIPFKQVSNVCFVQVVVSTTSNPPVHVLAVLDSEANSCFKDTIVAKFIRYP